MTQKGLPRVAAFGQIVAVPDANRAGTDRAKRCNCFPKALQIKLLVDHVLVLDLFKAQLVYRHR